MDTTFRASVKSEPTEQFAKPESPNISGAPLGDIVEVPFTEYMNSKHRPFTADYFETPLMWDDEVMADDIQAVENYLKTLVRSGELENTTKAAKEKLKKLEKMAGIDKLESKADKTIKLAEFVKYLLKLDERKYEHYK